MKLPYLASGLVALSAFTINAVGAAPFDEFFFPINVITTRTWTYSTKICSTSLGPKSCKFSTVLTTKKATTTPAVYTTITPIVYSTPTKIVTVKSTVTKRVTATITLPPVTKTRTKTVSESSTILDTENVTTLITVTETVSEMTEAQNILMIPVPTDFRYPNPGRETNFNFKRDLSLRSPDLDLKPGDIEHNELPRSFKLEARTYVQRQYPVKVFCTVYFGVIIPKTSACTARTKTIVRPTVIKTTACGTITVYATDRTTLSPTVTVDTTVTETTLTTTTVTDFTPTTVTVTVTSVSVSELPQETYYEACGFSNMVASHPDGRWVYGESQVTGVSPLFVPGITNPHECCVFCFQANGCLGARYTLLDSGTWVCAVTRYSGSAITCNEQDQSAGTYILYGDSISTYIINGPCGQWTYSGTLDL
ncbi:hypothetical protein TWF694_010118 [Orbilia ellipsospora]|uniref:Apple domain-containing protein n=1 Tax=Orbilia ellipsospora TaxID=2528407 RepID=A0AAV9X8X1_9PEZI